MRTDWQQSHGAALRTVRVEAALTGPIEHRRRARDLFEGKGWELLDAQEEEYPTDPDAAGVIPDEVDRDSVYTLRIPVIRDSGRRPELWAAQEIKDLADDAELDLRPMSARMLRRERRQEPHWFVYDPSSRRSPRRVRWLSDWEVRAGRLDTGEVLFGSYEDAERRAGQYRVRPPFLSRMPTHEDLPRIGATQGRRRVFKAVALCWAAGLLALPVVSGPRWSAPAAVVIWALLTWWCATTMLPLVRRPPVPSVVQDERRTSAGSEEDNPPDGEAAVHRRQKRYAWFAAVAATGGPFAATSLLAGALDPAAALGAHLLMAGAVFVPEGLRRLARAVSWRPFAVASFVALLPVVVPALGGFGPVLFTFYGAAFHVRAEEMDVAEAWQFMASVYVLATSAALMLVFLAFWGYLRPLLRERALRPLLPGIVLTGFMVLFLACTWSVVDGAEASGSAAVQQWRLGRVPDHYFGASPRPVCVSPIDPLDDLPLREHRLDPRQVYGTFGVVGGQATLWDPVSEDTFSVPADMVQVLPAGAGEPGSAIPRTCHSPS